MHAKESIADYLKLFEETQIARMAPRVHWPHILIPLQNKMAKDVVAEMPPEEKYSYDYLRAELLASASKSQKHLAKTFWEYHQVTPGGKQPMPFLKKSEHSLLVSPQKKSGMQWLKKSLCSYSPTRHSLLSGNGNRHIC